MQDYIGSLLSDISYLNEGFFVNGKLTEEGAKKRTISEEARIFFNEHFTMVDQSFGGIGELISGFSGSTLVCDKAIVIRNETIMEQGTLSVLYRGTEKDQDFITDFTMAVGAADELSSALNYYIKNMNVENINDFDIAIIINQINNFGNNSYLSLIGLQRENALDYFKDLITANPNAKVNVYGHSLGGYLANYVTIMGENYHNINKTITFNAPGFNYEQLSVIEILQNIEILRDSITSNDLKSKLQAGLDKIIEVSEKHYNTASLDKLNSIYSTTGPEFTTNDSLGMFHPELRIPLYTDDAGAISNHFVQYLREALPIYESLNMIMGGDKLVNYHTLSELFNSYQNPSKNHENKLISIMNYIFDYLDIENSFNNTFDILNYFSNLSQGDLNKLSYEKLTSSNYNDSPTHLYALFNLAPFVLIKDYNVFENPMYDINNYTKKNIDDRYDLYQKYQNAKDMKIIKSSIQSMGIYENYNIVYDDNENDSSYLIFDEYNKTIITNDYISVNSSFDFTGDELGNIKTTYFKSYQSTLIVNTLNNKVYDTYLDDNIALNKGETTLDLSYGNDTVMIDVAAGATLKNVTIKDGGVGDLFIFNGGAGSDFIQGTQYNDKIIGGAGDDHLFAGVGNDTIDGGLGSDIIFGEDGDDILIGGDGNDMLMGGAGSNSLSGGDGDDTLNAYNTLDEYHDIRGDILSGGSGTNSLFGTGYGDTYIYGGGIDTIRESDKHYGINYVDKLKFASNIQSSQVSLYNILNNLVIAINGLDKIFVIDYYNNNYSYLDEMHFINPITGYSIIWDTNYILQHTLTSYTQGTSNDDNITGTNLDDRIEGLDGNDTLNGGDGDDTILGGDGNDIIHGNNGNDTLYGDEGNDQLYGDAGNDVIYGGNGDDIIYGGMGNDIMYGEIGNDKIYGDVGDDKIYGGGGNDFLNGDAGNDIIYGDEGSDTINGGLGNDTIFGGYGNDIINGNDGNDTIYGDDGDDIITNINLNTNETDKIYGGNGSDKIYNYGYNVEIYGDEGNDFIYLNIGNKNGSEYSSGSGYANGGNGDDTIYIYRNFDGYLSNYIIEGGKGNDTITINRGNHNIIYNNGDGKDIINTYSPTKIEDIKITFNEISKSSININSLQLTGKGSSVIINFDENNSISLQNYLSTKNFLNSISSFIFNGSILTNIEFKNIATNIIKAESDGVFYDTVWTDIIKGTDVADVIFLSKGTDDNSNLTSRDKVDSGSGDDKITIADGNAIVHGDDGSDTIYNYGKDVEIYGDDGNDFIYLNIGNKNGSEYSSGSGYINGGNGNDTIDIYRTFDNNLSNYTVEGGKGNDTITINRGNHNIIYNNGDGKDIINTYSPNKIEEIKMTFNGIAKISVNIKSLQLTGKGSSVIINFDEDNSISLQNYLSTKNFLNSISNFIFNGSILTNIEFKNIATNIIKAESDGVFYDTVWTDKITGTNGDDVILISKGTDDNSDLKSRDKVDAGSGDDRITISDGNAIVHGDDGSDKIYNYGKDVEIYGDDGNDFIYLNIGNKNGSEYSSGSGYINGGDGNDSIYIYRTFDNNLSNYTVEGGKGNDTITINRGNHNIIYNNDDGNDIINTYSPTKIEDIKLTFNGISSSIINTEKLYLENKSNDVVFKFDDNNSITLKNYFSSKLSLNSISDFIFNGTIISNVKIKDILTNIKGTTDNDIIYDTIWEDSINLIGGNDIVYLNNGNDTLTTSNSKTTTYINSVYNVINSNIGNDVFTFTNTNNILNLTNNIGRDEVKISASTKELLSININTFFSNVNIVDMKNNITLGWGENTLTLNQSNFSKLMLNFSNYSTNNILDFKNKISGNDEDNLLKPLTNENITIHGNGGNDIINGGDGNDALYGDEGNDTISGGAGNDVIYGGSGNDILLGGDGNFDSLFGQEGNDTYHLSNNNTANDFYGDNQIYISKNMYGKNLILTDSGNSINFRTTDGSFNANFTGKVARIEKFSGLNNNTSYSLVGNEISRLFELQAALVSETDTSKITDMQNEISNLWRYD